MCLQSIVNIKSIRVNMKRTKVLLISCYSLRNKYDQPFCVMHAKFPYDNRS